MKLLNHLLVFGLALSSVTAVAESDKLHANIVGGMEAQPGEFPFIVSLQEGYMGHFCGGSLIKKNWVLTAGHCVTGTTIDKVVIGLHDMTKTAGTESLKVKRVIRHPKYNAQTTDYDFALLELASDSSFQPIDLNPTEIDIPTAGDSIMTTVAGWGATHESAYDLPERLQKVSVPLVAQSVCNKDYRGRITDRMICAGYDQGGKDSCQGDSGGPLVATSDDGKNYLIGVVSWGEGCARARKPGVYAKVNDALSWIQQYAQ